MTAVQTFVIDKIRENSTYEFSTRLVQKREDMLLCLKNSLFLKDLNLREQSEQLDSKIQSMWTKQVISEYKQEYIQFIVSRINNLAKLKRLDQTLEIIEAQLKLNWDQGDYEDYMKLTIQCLIVKS